MSTMETHEHDWKQPLALVIISLAAGLAMVQALLLWLVTKLLPSIPCNSLIDGKNCFAQPTIEQLIVSALVALVFVPFAWWAAAQLGRAVASSRIILRWSAGIVGYALAIWVSWTALRMVAALIGRFMNG